MSEAAQLGPGQLSLRGGPLASRTLAHSVQLSPGAGAQDQLKTIWRQRVSTEARICGGNSGVEGIMWGQSSREDLQGVFLIVG